MAPNEPYARKERTYGTTIGFSRRRSSTFGWPMIGELGVRLGLELPLHRGERHWLVLGDELAVLVAGGK